VMMFGIFGDDVGIFGDDVGIFGDNVRHFDIRQDGIRLR
jgi:hypothetical protein